jgi:poly(A) polymerase
MLRAVVFAERLDFELDPQVVAAIRRHKAHIKLSAPARLLDEYYKILRSGTARRSFERLAALGLLEHMSPELEHGLSRGVTASLDALDTYRGGFETVPSTLNNAILLGSLIAPIYRVSRARRRSTDAERNGPRPTLGTLPLARRDVDRLAQIQAVQPRLMDTQAPQRAQRAFAHRHVFDDALTWLEIHGGEPNVVAHWREVLKESRPASEEVGDGVNGTWRRRRRRRRRRTRHSVPSGDE